MERVPSAVMIDILENKLGEKRVKEFFEYMKTKT